MSSWDAAKKAGGVGERRTYGAALLSRQGDPGAGRNGGHAPASPRRLADSA